MAECDGVSGERPRGADEAERGEAHHQCVERVLRAYESAVKETEGGSHYENERGRDEKPGCVGAVDEGHGETSVV